ncbi:MAG: hypothetical protein ACRD0U_07960 [Acidimicrobiales bacterium]
MADCRCRPRVLADFYTNANAADGALGQVATDLETAYSGFYGACSDFVPLLGAPYSSIRHMQASNNTLSGFALDVANAFIAADGGHLDVNTMGRDFEMTGDSAEIEARVPEVSADRVRAERDHLAIAHALDTDDEEALREAMRVALGHSANGDNEAYSATLVILLGKDNIDRVLDSVDYESGMYVPRTLDAHDVATIAQPMAIIVQSATRSGNHQAAEIAEGYISEAREVESNNVMYRGDRFDPPEPRRRLGLLLTAGIGAGDWVARAADVMLMGEGAGNSTETVYFNEVALRAVGANDEASHLYLTSDDLISPHHERLVELLNADVQLTAGPARYGGGGIGEHGRAFNQLAGEVLESGLVQYPERFGDPLTTPAVSAEAARAASVYAEIVNMVAHDEDGNPFDRGGENDDPLRDSLARIGSSTWMMDRMARDAAGTIVELAEPATPAVIASVETLDDFYSELINSDEARRTLEVGSVAYLNASIGQTVAAMNSDLVRQALAMSGEVPIPEGTFPAVEGAAAQVAALARAINGNELTAADAENEAARWYGTLTESVTSGAGAIPVFAIPSALLSPLTNTAITEFLAAPAETPGAGGVFVVQAAGEMSAAIHAALMADPRFADLPPDLRQDAVYAVYEHVTGRFAIQLVVGQESEPRP